ncbi:PIGH, partial [Symbiodinium sp. KB8]
WAGIEGHALRLAIGLALASVVCHVLHGQQVVEESVLAVRGMGVQLQSKSAGGRQVTRFIDREQLRAAVVNEGYTCFSVRFYLAFLTAGSDELAVAFAGHTPRLPV